MNIISIFFAWGIIGKSSIGIAYENYNGISPDSLRNYDRNSLLFVNFLPIYQILKIFMFIYIDQMDVIWATNCLLFMLIISLLEVVTASIAVGFFCSALQQNTLTTSYHLVRL